MKKVARRRKAAKKKPLKKKPLKKKPLKKKLLKTKPLKKKPLKKKPPKKKPRKPKKHTVTLSEPNGPDFNPHLSVTHKDKVRWYNDTPDDRTLTFGVPIFTVPDTVILVPAYTRTGWYTISPKTPAPRSYGYGIDPSFDITGIPDPPQVSADG